MKERLFAVPAYTTAEEIRALRKRLKLTQREFAELICCAKSTVERWETSKENITGPVVLLLQMLDRYTDYPKQLQIPKREYPLRLWYMYRQKPCTLIDVNEMEQRVCIVNYTDKLMFRAFGKVEDPDYRMYEEFLESRCFPASRDKMKLVLQDLDLPFYDPLMIIEKTAGRMAEDDFWIQIER